MVAEAASKTSGLHKLLHCVGRLERARWSTIESTVSFPAIFFGVLIGIIVFIALSQLLLSIRTSKAVAKGSLIIFRTEGDPASRRSP
jgi:hypothetical protein